MSEQARTIIIDCIEEYKNGKINKRLDLGNCGLKTLPEEIKLVHWIEELILSNMWDEYDKENSEFITQYSINKGIPNSIISIIGVEKLKKLRKLIICKHWKEEGVFWSLNSLKPVAKLTNLEEIQFWLTNVIDIEPLKNLKRLKIINCFRCGIRDISPLKGLLKLEQVSIAKLMYLIFQPYQNIKTFHYLKFIFQKWKVFGQYIIY
ncbi:MAG: hypothetical protein IPK25_15795 [Saprospiraceae bacterium]|nr:hypothetical protein [Saprospiraceae bacterium]